MKNDLDQLMGKDRNAPLFSRGKKKESLNDKPVCKHFLVAFCPHDLFPNTKADLGPCPRRHDEYYKKLFEQEPEKERLRERYEGELMEELERIISQLDVRIRRAMAKIDVPGETDQHGEFQSRIEAINKKINFFLEQAERLGEEGRLDESEGIMQEIERLKVQRSELNNMSESSALQSERQRHICDVCGAMQSLNDTDKRVKMHLEGKLHTGYALIRKTLAEIKQSREEHRKLRKLEQERKMEEEEERVFKKSQPEEKKHQEQKKHKSPERQKERKEAPKESKKSRNRSKSRSKERRRRSREREKDRHSHDRHSHSRDRSRDRDRHSHRRRNHR